MMQLLLNKPTNKHTNKQTQQSIKQTIELKFPSEIVTTLRALIFTCKESVADCDANHVEEDEQDLTNLIAAQCHPHSGDLKFVTFCS